jgi:hypothetical protein
MASVLVVGMRDKFVKILVGRVRKGGYITVMTDDANEVFGLMEAPVELPRVLELAEYILEPDPEDEVDDEVDDRDE